MNRRCGENCRCGKELDGPLPPALREDKLTRSMNEEDRMAEEADRAEQAGKGDWER